MSSVNFTTPPRSAPCSRCNMTQQSLNTVQNQVSTGLAVATAADNSSYWSVAAQLNQNDGIVNAANTALTTGQSMLTTATNAINSVITTLKSMATALTEAQNPNANLGAINTSLQSLGAQLTDAVTNASFNGLNMLNGSVTTLRRHHYDDRRELRLRLQRDVQRRDGEHHWYGDPDGVWQRSAVIDVSGSYQLALAQWGGDPDFRPVDPGHGRDQCL